jgi:U3 small nucleolar RNA-associated protein 5
VLDQDTVLQAQENGIIFSRNDEHLQGKNEEQPNKVHLLGREAAAEAEVRGASARKRAASEAVAESSTSPRQEHVDSTRADAVGENDLGELGDVDMANDDEEKQQQQQSEPSLWEQIRELEMQNTHGEDVEEDKDETAAFRRSLPAGRAPRANSLSTLLSQALRADDRALLERCLSVSDESVIKRTVAALSSDEAIAFLALVVERLNARPHHGLHLSRWIRGVLCKHASYLMSAPRAKTALSALHQMIESRVSLMKPLLQLSGRLDLLLSQREGEAAGSGDAAPPMEPEQELVEAGDELKPVRKQGGGERDEEVSESEGEEEGGEDECDDEDDL